MKEGVRENGGKEGMGKMRKGTKATRFQESAIKKTWMIYFLVTILQILLNICKAEACGSGYGMGTNSS